MGLVKGGFQRILQTLLYALLFLCTAIILGFYSYFLSVLANRNIHIPTWEKAVEGISGAAVVYLIFAVCLTCCLGGIAALSIFAIIMDLLFVAGMLAIAVLTRHGVGSCHGFVHTPLGNGNAQSDNGYGSGGFGTGKGDTVTYAVHLGLACKYNKVCFAVSIIAAFLFLCTAVMQVMLMRHHKKEKRYGPGPSNNYTGGSPKKGLFGRKKKDTHMKEAEAGVVAGAEAHHHGNTHNHASTNNRVSHETGYTGTTVGGTAYENDKVGGIGGHHASDRYTGGQQTLGHQTGGQYAPNQFESGHQATTHGTHNAYHTAPTGTAVNPYGYSNNTATNY